MPRPTRRAALAALALALVAGAAACGAGDDGDAAPGSGSAPAAGDAAFPVTIEHKYGSTTIAAPPERVVSVGFGDQDPILALGVVPVGVRDWYGDQPQATWPWAHDLLEGAKPEVLSADELNVEAVAALRPDLIVGVSSGMTKDEYESLSALAPTLAQSGDVIDYGMPWQDGTRMIGRALGREAEADRLIAGVEERFARVRADVPGLKGAEATVSYVMDETQIGAYGPTTCGAGC